MPSKRVYEFRPCPTRNVNIRVKHSLKIRIVGTFMIIPFFIRIGRVQILNTHEKFVTLYENSLLSAAGVASVASGSDSFN